MGLYETFKTDPELEKAGTKVEFPANKDGTIPTFWLRRMSESNPAYLKAMEEIAKDYQMEIELGIFTNAQAEGPVKDAFIETIMLPWEHVQGPDGKEIEFTPANVLKLFKDLPDLYSLLRARATKLNRFQNATVEQDTGN